MIKQMIENDRLKITPYVVNVTRHTSNDPAIENISLSSECPSSAKKILLFVTKML